MRCGPPTMTATTAHTHVRHPVRLTTPPPCCTHTQQLVGMVQGYASMHHMLQVRYMVTSTLCQWSDEKGHP